MPRTCTECGKKFFWGYFQGCSNRACPLFTPEYAEHMHAYDRRRALMQVGSGPSKYGDFPWHYGPRCASC